MKQSSHKLDSIGIRFDAAGMVANAGLILPATLGERLGVGDLIDEHVHLGKVAGAANPGQKAMTVVALRISRKWPTHFTQVAHPD